MSEESPVLRTIGPLEDWYCLCANPWGEGRVLNGTGIARCGTCHMEAPWLERRTPSMAVRQIRMPHNSGEHNGWFTITRGAMVTRREALRILLFGTKRARIETVQTNNPELWR
jgi:hypothetical protein